MNAIDLNGQTLEFGCRLRKDHHFIRWKGKIRCESSTKLPYELVVSADGQQYRAFIGRYINGFYIAVPAMFIAADLSTPDDLLYNQNKLEAAGMTDRWALSFSQAFRVFDMELHRNEKNQDQN